MIITLEDLKAALGIAPDDVSKDALLNSSLTQAHGLIYSNIGYDLTDTVRLREYVYTTDVRGYYPSSRNFVHLPLWPVREIVDVVNGTGAIIAPDNYRLVPDPGRVDFLNGLPGGDYLTFHYRAGFDPVPEDLVPVATNIAASIYNNGGTVGSTNALKSLTMFDAMSMSFDTGDGSATSAQALLDGWAFVLGKYSVISKPVLK